MTWRRDGHAQQASQCGRDREKAMNHRTMNRRTLCKVVVAMGLLARVHPLKQLAAAEAPDTEKPSEPPEVLHLSLIHISEPTRPY